MGFLRRLFGFVEEPKVCIQPIEPDPRWLDYAWVEKEVYRVCGGFVSKLLFVKVVGVTFQNADGSSRLEVIRQCMRGEELQLVTDTIAEFPESVAVRRVDGSELGYLSHSLANDVFPEIKHGRVWRCFLQKHYYDPEDPTILRGAALVVARLPES